MSESESDTQKPTVTPPRRHFELSDYGRINKKQLSVERKIRVIIDKSKAYQEKHGTKLEGYTPSQRKKLQGYLNEAERLQMRSTELFHESWDFHQWLDDKIREEKNNALHPNEWMRNQNGYM